MIAKNALKWVD